ncbi:uncharacterized protein LOC144160941 [Haemaphysalis longicornis]
MASVKKRSILAPAQESSEPKGPWTKQMKGFPEGFCEDSITEHGKAAGATKHTASGYKLFKADKVSGILLHHDSKGTYIRAKVEASFSIGKLYNVMCIVHADGSVKKGHCLCAAGAGGVCKHVSALLWHMLDVKRMGHLFVPDAVSCTSKPRTWGPVSLRKRKLLVTEFSKLEFKKHVPGKAPKQQVEPLDSSKVVMTESALKSFCVGLEESGFSPMLVAHIDEVNYQPVNTCQPTESWIEEEAPIKLPLYVLGGEIREDMACSLSMEEAHELEKMTRGQNTPLWLEERKKRITASRFGDVVLRKAAVSEKFIASFLKQGNCTTHYMKVGHDNEENAISKYKELRGVEVHPVGLCVNPGAPFLGASPDGLVWDKTNNDFGLVEVKTLAKAMEDGLTVEEAIQKRLVPFFKEGKLSERHKYFYQIQGQLGVTGLTWCDLVVDSGGDIYVERIMFDAQVWEDMFAILQRFYTTHLEPSENNPV